MVDKKQYNPSLSAIKKDDEKEFADWYKKKFTKVSLSTRIAISGKVAKQEVKNICDKFEISDWQKVGYVARIFRDIFCGDLKEKGIQKMAIENIGIKQEDLNVFLQLIRESAKKMKQAGEKEYAETIDRVTLKEAVSKYPEIQEQLISDERLKLDSKTYLVPGTVKNWLTDYFQRVGGNKHDTLERGDYLFKSKSVTRLDQQERDDLSVILVAFDTEGLVAVDKQDNEINFNESRFLTNGETRGRDKLKGIIDSYDQGSLKTISSLTKESPEKSKGNKVFEKIKSTPHFEVDLTDSKKRQVEKKKDVSSLNNIISLKKEKEIEKKNRVVSQKNNEEQNVLDLSEYV